ncbi:serine hydrolase domain-containing protein [Chitinophagaceae bacterium LWZ2-11]
MKKMLKRLLLTILVFILGFAFYYCWTSFPIISGYGAKNMCSAVFLAGRSEAQERAQELSFFPMKYGTFTIDYKDSSVTGSVLGFAKRKAIYRKGLGATLINELSEEQVRAQQFYIPAPPAINQDSVAWPMGNRVTDSFPADINKHDLQNAIDASFIEEDAKNPVRTRAVVVLYKGKLIAEQYGEGFTNHTKLLGWSMTKSVTSALIGILVKDGKLNITQPAPVPEWSNPKDPRHTITIQDLLHQSSGLKFEENYSKSCDATKMLFGSADMASFTAAHPLKDTPGDVFYYSSGNSNILSRIIRHTVGEQEYHAFPYDTLFYKIGMYNSTLEPDASGTFVGSSYMYATARDWARFGLLYYNDGVWNGQRILPEGWVKQTVVPAKGAAQGQYGFQFWLNAGAKNNPANRKYPNCPTDMFCADGFEGQFVFVIPSKDLVIVRLGQTQHDNFNADGFVNSIVKSLK